MGLQDRDYMRKSSRDSGGGGSSFDELMESLLGGFFNRHRALIKVAALILGILIVAGIAMAVFAD
jgi:hypothetical protein